MSARSTFYDVPAAHLDDAEIVGRMQTICHEFEAYGYRRVGAELRHQGVIVNHKKIPRLRDCQESCVWGHNDADGGRIWQSRKTPWTVYWRGVTGRLFWRRTGYSTSGRRAWRSGS